MTPWTVLDTATHVVTVNSDRCWQISDSPDEVRQSDNPTVRQSDSPTASDSVRQYGIALTMERVSDSPKILRQSDSPTVRQCPTVSDNPTGVSDSSDSSDSQGSILLTRSRSMAATLSLSLSLHGELELPARSPLDGGEEGSGRVSLDPPAPWCCARCG